MTIREAQTAVDDWISSTGVKYFSELTNMAILTEEVGELARIIARKYGEQSVREGDKLGDAGEEMADILFVLLCLANQTGTDLAAEFARGIEKRNTRDSVRHRNNPKLKS